MDKQHILGEIRRTAKANGGKPLGMDRFCDATGIKEFDWRGKYWENFGDAQEEAGFERNSKQGPFDEAWLIEKVIGLIRELQRFPTVAALRLKRRSDPTFPASETFRRLGKAKQQRVAKVHAYCDGRPGYEDVLAICDAAKTEPGSKESENGSSLEQSFGFVYLMKSGRYYQDRQNEPRWRAGARSRNTIARSAQHRAFNSYRRSCRHRSLLAQKVRGEAEERRMV